MMADMIEPMVLTTVAVVVDGKIMNKMPYLCLRLTMPTQTFPAVTREVVPRAPPHRRGQSTPVIKTTDLHL